MKTRRLWVRLLAIPIFLAAVILVMARPVSGQGNPVATLDPIQGLVQVHSVNTPDNQWTTITASVTVQEGDTVRTDSLGVADLTFFEGVQSEIAANSQVTIGKFQVQQQPQQPATYQVTLQVAVGDVHNQIDQVLNAGSHYEVYTPAAAITVRGTTFWSSASWSGEAGVDMLKGTADVFGIMPNGQFGSPVSVTENHSLDISKDGQPGAPGPLSSQLPQLPPKAPLAPATCGDGICQIGEDATCAVDCKPFPTCGDGTCQLDQGENPVTCAKDCVPAFHGFPPLDNQNPQTGQPCQVETTKANVELHVGPGPNRGVLDFLTPNKLFTVLGQAQASDNSLWWKIQVPGATEAWVAQTDVTATGDCSSIGQADVPPIIFAQPSPVPTIPGVPTPQVPAMSISFYADSYKITYGSCTVIHWDVEGIKEVFFQGQGVTGHETRKVCLRATQTFTLDVITLDGQKIEKQLTITTYGG